MPGACPAQASSCMCSQASSGSTHRTQHAEQNATSWSSRQHVCADTPAPVRHVRLGDQPMHAQYVPGTHRACATRVAGSVRRGVCTACWGGERLALAQRCQACPSCGHPRRPGRGAGQNLWGDGGVRVSPGHKRTRAPAFLAECVPTCRTLFWSPRRKHLPYPPAVFLRGRSYVVRLIILCGAARQNFHTSTVTFLSAQCLASLLCGGLRLAHAQPQDLCTILLPELRRCRTQLYTPT